MMALVLLALALAETFPGRIPNPGFEQGMSGWAGFGHRGFRADVENNYANPRAHWLSAGWAARSRAPNDAEYRVSTMIDARRYRGRRIRVSAMTRVPPFAQGHTSLFAVTEGAHARIPLAASESWRRHGLVLAVPRNAGAIEIGFRLERTQGQLDADDVRLEILR